MAERETPTFPVGTRVIWDDLDGDCPGIVTAIRRNGDIIVKLDTGGAFQAPVWQLRKESE